MLSRNQFLSQPPAIVEPGATCPVCLELLEGRHPLRLRCRPDHVYCRQCIAPWATMHRRCTMMCEIRPFDIAPWTSIDPELIDQTRLAMLIEPLYTFGVPPGTEVDFITGPFTFNEDDTRVPRDGHWVEYLAMRTEPDMQEIPVINVGMGGLLPMSGTGLSEPQRMFIPIVNLANAIPILAANSDRPYTANEMQDWRLVVTNLVNLIPMRATVFPEIEKVPADLKASIRDQIADMGWNVEAISLLQPGPQGTDLDLLMEYVAYTMYRECWRAKVHTRAGWAALVDFRRQRRLQAMQFEQATWTLEDPGRQCEMM